MELPGPIRNPVSAAVSAVLVSTANAVRRQVARTRTYQDNPERSVAKRQVKLTRHRESAESHHCRYITQSSRHSPHRKLEQRSGEGQEASYRQVKLHTLPARPAAHGPAKRPRWTEPRLSRPIRGSGGSACTNPRFAAALRLREGRASAFDISQTNPPPGAAAYNGNDRQRWPPALMVAGVRGACDGGDEKSRESGFRRLKAGLRENGRPDKFGFLPHAPAGVLISTVSCLARCPPGILRPSVPHRPAPSRPRV